MDHELKEVIKKCDLSIKQENFDTLTKYYTEDAILVVKPGMIARGKAEIKKAEGHRDVVGAMNILDKSVHKQLTKNRELPKIEDTKYRRVLLAPIFSHNEAKRAVA